MTDPVLGHRVHQPYLQPLLLGEGKDHVRTDAKTSETENGSGRWSTSRFPPRASSSTSFPVAHETERRAVDQAELATLLGSDLAGLALLQRLREEQD